MTVVRSLEELQKTVQRLKAHHQKLEGKKQTHEEELEKVKVEIKEAGFSNFKQLKEARDEAKALEEKYRLELEELLRPWEDS